MSEEQLSALLAKLKDDAVLREKFHAAGDLDAAVALAKKAGYDANKSDWLRYQAKQVMELSDADLEVVAGGFSDWIVSIIPILCLSKAVCGQGGGDKIIDQITDAVT